MPREDHIEFEGVVLESSGGIFRVDLKNGAPPILAKLNGKMRQNRIRVIAGDAVRVAISPYDLTRGLIVFRSKG
jgi:translation initiation factor IF-1